MIFFTLSPGTTFTLTINHHMFSLLQVALYSLPVLRPLWVLWTLQDGWYCSGSGGGGCGGGCGGGAQGTGTYQGPYGATPA